MIPKGNTQGAVPCVHARSTVPAGGAARLNMGTAMPKRIAWAVAGLFVTAALPIAAQSSRDAEREARRAAEIRERMAGLTPSDFLRTATLQDDDLETVAVLTTEPGFHYRGGFTDRARTDSFMRAIITKRTGTTTYQVYSTIGPADLQRGHICDARRTANCRGCGDRPERRLHLWRLRPFRDSWLYNPGGGCPPNRGDLASGKPDTVAFSLPIAERACVE